MRARDLALSWGLLTSHRAVSFAPPVLSELGGLTVSTTRAYRLCLVKRVSPTSSAPDVCGLLSFSHTWSTLGHTNHLLDEGATGVGVISVPLC